MKIEDVIAQLPENASKEQVTAALKEFNDKIEKEHKDEIDKTVREKVSEEKDKLYDSIKKERSEKDLAQKERDEARKSLEDRIKAEKGEGGADSERRIKELETQLESVKNNATELVTQIRDEFKKELTLKELEAYKDKLVAGAQGKIVSELVRGSTKEELEKSVEEAKSHYAKIAEDQRKQIEAELLAKGVIPAPDGHKSGESQRGGGQGGAGEGADWRNWMTKPTDTFLKDAKEFLDKEFPK